MIEPDRLYPVSPGLPLSCEHVQMLAVESAISHEVIAARGYRTITDRVDVPESFANWQRRLGLLVPTYSPDGETASYQLRPNVPIVRKSGNAPKYETPAGSRITLDVNPLMLDEVRAGSGDLWITEGSKKIDSLTSRGLPTVGIIGVWNFAEPGSKSTVPLPCWSHVRLRGRRVVIVYDADAKTNANVHEALRRLVAMLGRLGAVVRVVYLPPVNGDGKAGVDDWLAAGGTVSDLEALARHFEPVNVARERLSRDDELRATTGDLWAAWRDMPATTQIVWKPREEWVAVPVPDSGIPRQWADAARDAVKDNPSVRLVSDYRVYELASVFVCGVCGRRMTKNRKNKSYPYTGHYHYYICPSRINDAYDSCAQVKGFRAEPIEGRVWQAVRSLMLEPIALHDALERMVEEERSVVRGDPDRDVRRCLEQLTLHDRKRSGFQDMAAEGLITLDELRSKLAGLEELRRATAHELQAARSREERLKHLESDRETLLRNYENIAPEALDSLTPEERQQLYRLLRLKLTAGPPPERELTITGILGEEFSGVGETNMWVMPLRRNA